SAGPVHVEVGGAPATWRSPPGPRVSETSMRTTDRTLALVFALAAATLAPGAFAQRLLWHASPAPQSLPADPTPAARSVELADDFDAWGEVAGVAIAGAGCDGCAPAAVAAVE